MDVLRMLGIIYNAYEPTSVNSFFYQYVRYRESFKGILIESYYGTFCDKLITPFGMMQIANGESMEESKLIETYIKSRIKYRCVIDMIQNQETGCVGPFYLVTHIDGKPVEHDSVKGLTPDTYFKFIYPNIKGNNEYISFIESCIHKKIIRDKRGILDDILAEPDIYTELVKYLEEGLKFKEVLYEDKLFHIFVLLFRKKMLLF